jgi:hypothetical protein
MFINRFPSICIPHLRESRDKVENVLNKLKKGKYNCGFIYLIWDITNPKIKKMQESLIKGEEINLVYNFPWFWKCRANHDITELKYENLIQVNNKNCEKLKLLRNKMNNLQYYTKFLIDEQNHLKKGLT